MAIILNELGEQIYKEIAGEDFLTKHKELLFAMIEERQPKTAYDVEEASGAVCAMLTSEDIFNGMKDFVYNSPSYKIEGEGKESLYDLTLRDVCFILSIPLRDMYLHETKKFENNY